MKRNETKHPKIGKQDSLNILETAIRNLLTLLITAPDDLKIEVESYNITNTIQISACSTDTSRIIGPHGSHFDSLREMIRMASEHMELVIDLLPVSEPPSGSSKSYSGFVRRAEWNEKKITDCLVLWAQLIFGTVDIDCNVLEDRNRAVLTLDIPYYPGGKMMRRSALALGKIFKSVGKANGQEIVLDISSREQ